jgi:tetratricopeptide (TPR) repeat protein
MTRMTGSAAAPPPERAEPCAAHRSVPTALLECRRAHIKSQRQGKAAKHTRRSVLKLFEHDHGRVAGTGNRRLIGWKAIGQFLGCTERTARRWEADRALPVHRIPGGARSSVWASPEELTAWLRTHADEVEAAQATPAPHASAPDEEAAPADPEPAGQSSPKSPDALPPKPPLEASASEPAREAAAAPRRPWLWRAVIAAAVLLLLGGIAAGLVESRHSAQRAQRFSELSRTPYDDNAEARVLYLNARFEFSKRSAESLASAGRDFGQLVQRYPERPAGWSGLAETFLLLREFGTVPDNVAYPEAARAARTAIALDSKQSTAWLDEAYVTWWWKGDSVRAFHQFATALQLDPSSARAHHWFATALAAHGDFTSAVAEISRARALSPDTPAIVADEAYIAWGSGEQPAAAMAALERLTRTDPQFESPHFYLSRIYLLQGRDADFLREAQVAAQLRGQQDVLDNLHLAEARLHSGGRAAMLAQLAQAESDRWRAGRGSAVFVAQYDALAGNRSGMLQWLAIAEAHHDPYLPTLRGQPEFTAVRTDPAFLAVMNRTP